jgi:hypothetical protein
MSMRALIAVVALVAGLSGLSPLGGSAAQVPVPGQAPVPGQVPAPAVQEPPTVQKKLQLTFDGQGNVTLIAQGVTLQEILAEWTRVGGCYFPNADRLSRAMMVPLQFEKVPELTVLDSLLRSAAGIVVAPRTTRTVGASAFELVQILATSTATQTGSFSPINSMPPPMPTAGNPDDEIPPVTPVNQPQRGADPTANRPPPTTTGVPGSGVFVPIQPVPSGQQAPGQPPAARPGMPTPVPSPPPAGSAGS